MNPDFNKNSARQCENPTAIQSPTSVAPAEILPACTAPAIEVKCSTAGMFTLMSHFGNTPYTAELIGQLNATLSTAQEQGLKINESAVVTSMVNAGRERFQAYKFLNENPENRKALKASLENDINNRTSASDYEKENGVSPEQVRKNADLVMDSYIDGLATDPGFKFQENAATQEETKPLNKWERTAQSVMSTLTGRSAVTPEGITMMAMSNQHPSETGPNDNIPRELTTPRSVRITAGTIGFVLESIATVTTYFQNLPVGAEQAVRVPENVATAVRAGFAFTVQGTEFISVFVLADLIRRFKEATNKTQKIEYGMAIGTISTLFASLTAFDFYSTINQAGSIGLNDPLIRYPLAVVGIAAPFLLNLARGGVMTHADFANRDPLKDGMKKGNATATGPARPEQRQERQMGANEQLIGSIEQYYNAIPEDVEIPEDIEASYNDLKNLTPRQLTQLYSRLFNYKSGGYSNTGATI